MKTHTSKKALWGKRLLLLPVLVLMLYSFSNREIVVLEQQTTAQQITAQSKKAMETRTEIVDIIEVFINKNGQLLVSYQLVELEELSTFLLRYNKGLTKEQRSQTVPSIITIDKEAPKKVIKEVEAILTDYGVATVNIQERMYSQQEKGATKAEIKEYNALARQKVIKKADISRVKQLYDRMSADQRASAEPFPNFPPPPPPAKTGAPTSPKGIKNSNLPPPPPLPAYASEEYRIAYNKAVEDYKKGNRSSVYDHLMEDGELVEIIVIEDENNVAPPPPPMPPAKHLAELAEQGATFYLNGDPISSKEAIQLVTKNKNINIDIRGVDSEATVVKLTTKTNGN